MTKEKMKDAIVKMVVQDLVPLHFFQKSEGFAQLNREMADKLQVGFSNLPKKYRPLLFLNSLIKNRPAFKKDEKKFKNRDKEKKTFSVFFNFFLLYA